MNGARCPNCFGHHGYRTTFFVQNPSKNVEALLKLMRRLERGNYAHY